MQESIIQQGVDLLIFGMGTVFVFLTVLVIATLGMSTFIRRFFPDAVVPETKPAPATSPSAVDPKHLAIIKAAIEQHRSKQ
ncbi:OadG family protein [Pseudomaricurvus sp.]|uniref:OadG family protein n=1 Tax=Pseudomaricurvus sp. TaxID=2004510 RepID=UPI003F6CF17B